MARYAPADRRVAFISDRSGRPQLWLREDDQAAPRLLTDWPPLRLRQLAWSGDGRRLSVVAIDAQNLRSVLLLPVDAPAPLQLDQVRRLPLGQTPVAGLRLLGSGGLAVWLEAGTEGWRALMQDLDDPAAQPQSVAGLLGVEPVLQVDSEVLYFTDAQRAEILRVEPPYQRAQVIASGISRIVPGRWRLAQGEVWYVWLDESLQRSLLYRAPLPGPLQAQPVLDLGELRVHPGFEIAADASRILLQRISDDETDIARTTLPAR